MESDEPLFKHPLSTLIEDYLSDKGLVAGDLGRRKNDEIVYSFRSERGSTIVIRLYRHQDEGEPLKHWLCFEFGVGVVVEQDAPAVLHAVCRQMHTCFIPLRAAAMPYEESKQILILILRAESDAFHKAYVETILDLGLQISDELREGFDLPTA